MANVRYTDVQARPTEFLDVTSVTCDEFQQLVPPVEAVSKRLWPHDDHGEGYPSSSRYFSPNTVT